MAAGNTLIIFGFSILVWFPPSTNQQLLFLFENMCASSHRKVGMADIFVFQCLFMAIILFKKNSFMCVLQGKPGFP